MFFSVCLNFSIHIHKEHCETNVFFSHFFNFNIHLHKERYKTKGFFTFFIFSLHLHKVQRVLQMHGPNPLPGKKEAFSLQFFEK